MTAQPACPVCGVAAPAPFETFRDPIGPKDYSIHDCPTCGLVYAWPFEFPGEAWYSKFNYHEGYQETAEGASEGRFRYFLDRLPFERGKIIDIGCAAGSFVALAAARGHRAEGLEMDGRFVEMARAAGIEGVRQGTLDDAFAREHAGAYDAVSIFEVYEHVDDPKGVLRRIGALLKSGGTLLLSVPDNRRPTPFGRDLWDYPPHHLSRWSPAPLRRVLEETGFSIVSVAAEPLEVWEYSRIWADRSAQWILKAIKAVLFGLRAPAKPMDELLKEQAASGAKSGSILPDKSTRVRLVATYHKIFHIATYPAFLLFLLYYRATSGDCGLRLFVVARKNGKS